MACVMEKTALLNESLEKVADKLADLAGNAGLVGAKLPGGYVSVETGPGVYVLTRHGKRLVRGVSDNDDFMQFHKAVGQGLEEKIVKEAKSRAKALEEQTNALLEQLVET